MPKPRLHWYEDLMLLALARSPRIHRIMVELETSGSETSADEADDDELDDPEFDFVPFLEHLYRSPSADKDEP
jgi:hypothetical protein